MSFTVGLLLVFLTIFSPGLIFLRSYFIGEFSKQFNTKVPIIRLAFYSLIPGLFIFLISIFVYGFFDPKFSVSGALEIYLDLLFTNNKFSNQTSFFLDNNLMYFLLFIILMYLASFLLGLFFHYIIRKLNWDKRYKVLRFKNYWYYLFSGEIGKFPKFNRALIDIQINDIDKDTDVSMAYADILTDECGKTKMYTGYVLDYELDQENSNQLDKIYLLDAHKYNYVQNKKFRFQKDFIKRSIPGHLFIIDYKKVLNINITYIPSFNRIYTSQLKNDIKRKRWDRILYFVLFSFLASFISIVWFNWPFQLTSNFKSKLAFTMLFLLITNIVGLSVTIWRTRYRNKKLNKIKSKFDNDQTSQDTNKDVCENIIHRIDECKKDRDLAIKLRNLSWLSIPIYLIIYLLIHLIFMIFK